MKARRYNAAEKLLRSCPVCEVTLPARAQALNGGAQYAFDCPRCGSFIFSEELYEDFSTHDLDQRERAAVSHAIRRAQKNTKRQLFTNDVIRRIKQECFLPTPKEQADNLIRWLGEALPAPGERIEINILEHRAIVGAVTNNGLIFIIKQMLEEGLLDGKLTSYFVPDSGHHVDGAANLTLTFQAGRDTRRYAMVASLDI